MRLFGIWCLEFGISSIGTHRPRPFRKSGRVVSLGTPFRVSLVLGTSYIPPVKQKLPFNDSNVLGTSPLSSAHLSRKLFVKSLSIRSASLSPRGESAPQRYQYPACTKAAYHPLSRLHDSSERPFIVPHEVVCLHVLQRALSPIAIGASFLNSLDQTPPSSS